MQTEILESVPGDETWCGAWDSGLQEQGPLAPFLSRTWIDSWRRTFASGKRWRMLAAKKNGALQAALPLLVEDLPAGPLRIPGLRYAASGLSGRTGPWLFGEAESALVALLRGLDQVCPRWQILELPDVEEHSTVHRLLLQAAATVGMDVRSQKSRQSPYIVCESSFAAWLAKRSRNFRSNRNRKLNRSRREGELEFVECLGGAAVTRAMPSLLEVSRQSWKAGHGGDMAGSVAVREFFAAIAAGGPGTHDIDAWQLRIAGHVVAMQVYWGNSHRKCLLRTDFCESAASLSPGDMLQAHVIERCHILGVREIDLGGRNYGYKARLTSAVRSHVSLRFYRPGVIGSSIRMSSQVFRAVRQQWRHWHGGAGRQSSSQDE